MSYTALYRKWRPKDFNDVYGQDHIVKTLTNQIMAGRIAHAYLLCGTRGTGKTSTAKIFAQAVNCESPILGNPCHQCDTCRHIESHTSMNVIEIDAASNNGVDNIREIREEVKYTPTEGKYKVYIIDEVHMLSTGAFNALLKTLEEPPSHVIFILATTEPHKILATILSRCQRYDFKRIGIGTISQALTLYMEEEQIIVEEKAIKYVAKVADGSMRDALSILDQCIAFYLGETVTLDKVLDVLGAVDNDVFVNLTVALHRKDAAAAMAIIELITMQGRDLSQFLVDMVVHLRNLLVTKSIVEAELILDVTSEYLEVLKEQGKDLADDEILYLIKQLSELESKIKYTASKRILIEVAFLKLCQPSMDNTSEGVLNRVKAIENQLEEGVFTVNAINSSDSQGARSADSNQSQIKSEHTQNSQKRTHINVEAVPEDIKEVIKEWRGFIERLEAMNKAFMKKAIPLNLEDDILYILCDSDVAKNHLSIAENFSKISHVLETMHHKQFNLKLIDKEEYNQLTQHHGTKEEGYEDAKHVYEQIKSKINFDVEIR
jgi:DNA polymerase III subunit gamma/tau